ncbi:LysR family transcriptional regulator [Chelativorans alearense]|uniref:LysR family transcriptional regulator n=1 Tax=Chelativorans alearense TaxID=2681495 RepID=UPI001FE60C45|nr:LysR substrate-binding domain-containing protein [Chelativorans alearense]
MNSEQLTKSLTLRHLRIIAALAEFGLVAKVADSLNVTQPSVSKQISELERLVETPIVTRDRNRLYLTPVGRRLADHARQVLAQIDRAAFDLNAMAQGVTGAVSVGAVSSVAPILLPGTIALMKRSAPEASISVTEGHFVSLFPRLESGAIDILIARVWHPQELPGVEQKALFQEQIVVVAGCEHPLAAAATLDWPEAREWPWLLPLANSVARRAIEALFAEFGFAPPVNLIASASLPLNIGVMREMPALGLFPQSLAQVHASRGELVILPLDTRGLLSEVRCFWRTGQYEANSSFDLFMQCLDQARSA